MRIGLLYMGDDKEYIWGSAITTFYLGQALERLGHTVWRASAESEDTDWRQITSEHTDFVIAEGVHADDIPESVWQETDYVIQWWLTTLFYTSEAIVHSPFAAIATNSPDMWRKFQEQGRASALIPLAAPEDFAIAIHRPEYASFATYLGSYPLKTESQMALMFRDAHAFGLTIWGHGWEQSPYKALHKGVLPLTHIGSLYKSVDVSFSLTEPEQRSMNMINNRVFEVLICGALLVSEPYASLETGDLGEFIHFVEDNQMLVDLLERIQKDATIKEHAQAGADYVRKHHTYQQRAEAFLSLYNSL